MTTIKELREMVAKSQSEFYGDDEDWQPAYLAVSPELDEVVVAEDIALIPVGWYVENACFDVEHIVNKIYGTIETSGAVLR